MFLVVVFVSVSVVSVFCVLCSVFCLCLCVLCKKLNSLLYRLDTYIIRGCTSQLRSLSHTVLFCSVLRTRVLSLAHSFPSPLIIHLVIVHCRCSAFLLFDIILITPPYLDPVYIPGPAATAPAHSCRSSGKTLLCSDNQRTNARPYRTTYHHTIPSVQPLLVSSSRSLRSFLGPFFPFCPLCVLSWRSAL